MADNVAVTPGAGATIATDEVGGLHYQKFKQVYGPDGDVPVVVTEDTPLPVFDQELIHLTQRMVNRAESPLGYSRATGRNSVSAIIESGTVTTVTTVTTVSTVTNMANMGNVQAQIVAYGQNLSAWNACVRSRIT